MQERMGQAIAVENRSGANGGIAVNALTSAPADGQTFVVSDGAIASDAPVTQAFSERVLIVEDDHAARVGLEQLVRSWGFLAVHGSCQADQYALRVTVCQACKHYILCLCFRSVARC